MAAVQGLVQWLKTRRSARKKRKDANPSLTGDMTSDTALKLSSRTGVALPPIPPPGFMNLPDVSRDCARSPYYLYDEIPAYAIDTRLDIIRDAQLDANNRNSQRAHECQPYLVVPLENNDHHQEQRQHDWNRRDLEIIQRFGTDQCWSTAREFDESTTAQRGFDETSTTNRDRVPRRGTPWHHFRDSEDCSPTSASVDQLDQWVSIEDNLSTLSFRDNKSECTKAQRQRSPENFVRSCQNGPNYFENQPWCRTGSRPYDTRAYAHKPGYAHDGLEVKPGQERAGIWSDDSGVSSPSNTSATRDDDDVSWCRAKYHQETPASTKHTHVMTNDSAFGVLAEHVKPRTEQRSYQTRFSATPYPEPDNNHPAATSTPSAPVVSHHTTGNHGSPEIPPNADVKTEYFNHLRKTENNLEKTQGVKSIVNGHFSAQYHNVTDTGDESDSFDLTTVTSMSDMSTFSDEEVRRLMSESAASQRHSLGRTCSNSAPTGRTQTANQSRQGKDGSQSAFRPYASQHRRHSSSTVPTTSHNVPSTVSESVHLPRSDHMTLEERLSCRVTTGVPQGLRPNSDRQKSGYKRASFHASSSSQNKVLSDIMRINHDRQILSLI